MKAEDVWQFDSDALARGGAQSQSLAFDAQPAGRLPAGYGAIDAGILKWIATSRMRRTEISTFADALSAARRNPQSLLFDDRHRHQRFVPRRRTS